MLQELSSLEVGFVSLSETHDLTTPSNRALAGRLAIFAEFERDILRDRVSMKRRVEYVYRPA
jgi:DNA invertase Pin-like site-specific DNA recombinase